MKLHEDSSSVIPLPACTYNIRVLYSSGAHIYVRFCVVCRRREHNARRSIDYFSRIVYTKEHIVDETQSSPRLCVQSTDTIQVLENHFSRVPNAVGDVRRRIRLLNNNSTVWKSRRRGEELHGISAIFLRTRRTSFSFFFYETFNPEGFRGKSISRLFPLGHFILEESILKTTLYYIISPGIKQSNKMKKQYWTFIRKSMKCFKTILFFPDFLAITSRRCKSR